MKVRRADAADYSPGHRPTTKLHVLDASQVCGGIGPDGTDAKAIGARAPRVLGLPRMAPAIFEEDG